MDAELKKGRVRAFCRGVRTMAACVLAAALALGGTPVRAAGIQELVPVGKTVGIELDIDGAVVVNVAKMKENSESVDVAEKAGIRTGDILVQIGETAVHSAEDVRRALEACGGAPVDICLVRGGVRQSVTATPAAGADGGYALGVWLRDAIYGLGTVTCYEPATGRFYALGHAVTDADTGVVVPLEYGRILPAEITGIVRGKCGTPGQLQGVFEQGAPLGTFSCNTACGISGKMDGMIHAQPVPVASGLAEVCVGPAVIVTDAAGGGPEEYAVEITRIYSGGGNGGRELMLSVTDERLLNLTGGIVQGMSGSPILQNGKLIGAVTHVLIKDPTKGYGISVGNMLAAADSAHGLENVA